MKRTRSIRLAIVMSATMSLPGCAQLYNSDRAASAAKIAEQYKTADVAGLITTQRANLDALLTEELAAVRENQKIQNDFAILSIADDDTPMAVTLVEEAMARIGQLGFESLKDLQDGLDDRIDHDRNSEDLQLSRDLIIALNESDGSELPRCGPSLPGEIEVKVEEAREAIEDEYKTYKENCSKILDSPHFAKAGSEWTEAKAALEERMKELAEAQNGLKAARASYRTALDEALGAKQKGEELEQSLDESKEKLGKALEAADKLGVGGGERVDSILAILAATAGGEVDEDADPSVKAAALIAERVPSLAGDIAAMRKRKRAPNVSNLLIEMQHQIVMLDYQKRMRDLDQQEVDLLEVKYRAVVEEARQWLKFSNAMCSFAVLSANATGQHPGEQCLEFVATVTPKGKAECRIGDSSISNCALDQPWNEALTATSKSRPKRELYKALTAYLQALSQQSIPAEQNFRRIDLLHRRTLAARESSIRAWDNVVAVPIAQLESYFKAGVKPEEIADLIVKALGFTAVGAGLAL